MSASMSVTGYPFDGYDGTDQSFEALAAKTWVFNGNRRDKDQVLPWFPAYLEVLEELNAAGKYHYNDAFKGRIPGIEGPDEDLAIYMLQGIRSRADHTARLDHRRAGGWRDFDPAELGEFGSAPVRYAGIVSHSFYTDGTGWQEWSGARLTWFTHSSVMVLAGRARTRGTLPNGPLLVLDAGRS
jgi:hypothetical protein